MLSHALVSAALLTGTVFGQSAVVGTPTGFGSGATGGGDATPAAPSDITELTTWLTDDVARVILIDKEFDFTDSEGTTTEDGCRPDSNTCPDDGGQDAINGGDDWCGDYPTVSVTYDNAAITPIDVASDKSIVGVGSAGVIRGKGFRVANGATNVIFQNIHITELNPQYIWGGDAITLVGTDNIWIDHCKFSLIGRQMIVTGYDAAGHVTISNNEFDGQTSWSATCNGEHYWTMLFYGADDQVTLANNYIHDCSGRAPKVAGSGATTMHAVNNYFENIGGHDFDIGVGGSVLIEGNVFSSVDTPITDESATAGGYIFNVPDSSAASTCSSYLGRDCQVNTVTDSGDFASYSDTDAVSDYSSADSIVDAAAASSVASSVTANAGIGKLSDSSSSSGSVSSAAAAVSSGVFFSSAAIASSAVATPSTFLTFASSAIAQVVASTPAAAASSPVAVASSAAATPVASSSAGTLQSYEQCGGKNWSGSGACAEGLSCKVWNDWYSQCV